MNTPVFFQSDRPFRATPDIRLYYPFASMEAARETIVRALVRAEGPALVVGGAGYGKSLLAELVMEAIYPRLDVVNLQSAQLCSRRALLQNILFSLQLPYRELSEGELRLSILDRLEPSPETAPEGVLIIVDEAQTLHWKLIDELRLLSNYTRNNQPRVRLLLLGNMRLEDTLASPQLESLNQRLAARCYLQPMTRSETLEFVRHQLHQVGMQSSTTITQDALQAVFAASQGIPRLVNQIMDHALVLAEAHAQLPISTALINETWADLQQLPAPWTDSKPLDHSPNSNSTIEIGVLMDEDQELTLVKAPSVENSVRPIENLIELLPVELLPSNDHESERQKLVQEPSLLRGCNDANDASQECDFPQPDDQQGHSISVCSELPLPHQNYFSAFVVDESMNFAECQELISDKSEVSVVQVQDTSTRSSSARCTPTPAEELEIETTACMGPSEPESANIGISAEERDLQMELAAYKSSSDSDAEMWDDDPPLRGPNKSIFGDDFDDEILVPNSSGNETANSCRPSISSSEKAAGLLPEREPNSKQLVKLDASQTDSPTDYLQRLQSYADAITRLNQHTDENFSSVVTDESAESVTGSVSSLPWSLDVRSDVCSANSFDYSLEDIVSHLNFSALTTQPFSVEQIELNPLTQVENGSKTDPQISRGSHPGHEVPAIRYSQPERFALTASDCDDDRDLLIIEEDVPIGARLLETNLSNEPPMRLSPYSQLFAKLRK